MAGTTKIKYVHERYWAKQAEIDHWDVVPARDQRLPRVIGKCPKCLHENELQLVDSVVAGGIPSAAADTPPPAVTRVIDCCCNANHDQPAGVNDGCGRFWLATLTLQPDDSYQLTVENDPVLYAAASDFKSALDTQNRAIQSSAEKWTAGIAALYGLFSLSGVATAKDALAGLHTGGKIGIAIAFLCAAISAAVSLVLGYRAAYGWPVEADVSDNTKLLAWHEKRGRYAVDAARQLRMAVAFAFVSLAALSVMVSFAWFLPRK